MHHKMSNKCVLEVHFAQFFFSVTFLWKSLKFEYPAESLEQNMMKTDGCYFSGKSFQEIE